ELILCLHEISECYCTYASTSSQNSSAHFSRIAQFVFLLMEPDDQIMLKLCTVSNVTFMAYNLDQLFNQMHIYSDHNDRNDSNPSMSLQLSPNFKYYVMRYFKHHPTFALMDDNKLISGGN
ncbi:hypothetical protein LOAG_12717, partial [Loa loa]